MKKQQKFLKTFYSLTNQEEKYHHVISLGRSAAPMILEDIVEKQLVQGCQSLLYLKVEYRNKKLLISTHSDALISAGLAFILTQPYNEEPPQAVFKCPPTFIKEMGLLSVLSLSRSNGLNSLYQNLQKESLKWVN